MPNNCMRIGVLACQDGFKWVTMGDGVTLQPEFPVCCDVVECQRWSNYASVSAVEFVTD